MITLSVLLNAAFIFYACTKQQVRDEADEPGGISAKTGAQAELTSAPGICYGPFNGMPQTDVMRMIKNYDLNQRTAIRNQLGFRDAKNCWFDIVKLKNFICQAETILQQSGCSLKISGVRFHYAAHDQQSVITYGLPLNYQRLHTLIMIPTYYDSVRKEHFDFNPFLITAGNCVPIPLTRQQGATEAGNVPPGNIFAEDTGQLGPPDEDGIGRTAQKKTH